MKNYLSFGGGVNSVALYLYLADQGIDFEAVFVNHYTDWPETYDYVAGFQWWLKREGLRPITVLHPFVQGSYSLYDYCWKYEMVPSFMRRWCTLKFKIKPLMQYFKPPAYSMLGIDAGEAHRAKIVSEKGIENRYPLVEAGISRDGCKEIIRAHGLPVPQKSGCFICPYQRQGQWKRLRAKHPDLFCRAEQLEKRNMNYRISLGKTPLFLCMYPKAKLRDVVNEKQRTLWAQDEYQPCHCGL